MILAATALAPRDRSLMTIAALIALGQTEQLPAHLEHGLDNGLSQIEIGEAATHSAFYAGWPKAMSAMPVLQAVLAGRQKS